LPAIPSTPVLPGSPRNSGPSAIFGSGEMAGRIRAFDWESTPVGPIEQWEDTLLTTVNLMLASRHAMFLFWGDDFIQVYNDAYRATLDDLQHPLALGNRGPVSWAKIWPIIGPQLNAVMSGEALYLEDQFIPGRRSGPYEDSYWNYSYTPVRNIAGAIRGVFVVCTDVTEGHRAQKMLIQTEKLAAVGQMASTIAHEINNPLESVTNLLFLARQLAETAQIKEYLDLADQELRRIAAISSQTLRFHRQLTSPTEVQCEVLFSSSLVIYERRIQNLSIRVEKRMRATQSVLCYEGEIRQVLNNLIGNALDALSAGGRILLRSADATDPKTGRKGLRLTVADNGSGISPQVVKRIFDAFFTTKGFLGTGLGLWVCQDIVTRHGGYLRVRSSQRPERHGSVFYVFLPFDAVSRT
jgi:signal transduction histidine kinase